MQSVPRPQPIWHKEHLWLALQALGFEPTSEAALAGKTMAHITFGVNMFDKPNKDAFFTVFHFLFTKLDGTRCKEAFRYCWPPLDKKRDAEFRKVCCEWLRKISEDVGSGFPQVVASIFLSPGGPKFVHLLYHFVRYVLLQHVRKDAGDASSYVAEALQARVQDTQKAFVRNRVARHRYLQMLQRENLVIMEYQRKTQVLVKQIRDLRSDCAAALEKRQRTGDNVRDGKSSDKKMEVQHMWNMVMDTMKAIESEVEVVDSVVKGNIDQYCLDGSKVTLSIPNTLVDKIETEMHRLQMENVYEAGKVNLITVIQLLNEALQLVKQERHKHNCSSVPLDLHYVAGKTKFEMEILRRLRNIRHRIKREDLVAIDKAIVESEREWEQKWRQFLGKSPFGIYKVLDLQPLITSISFEPASEEEAKDNLYCQYAPCYPDELPKDIHAEDINGDTGTLKGLTDVTVCTQSGRNTLPLFGQTPPLKRRRSLNEQDFRTPSPFAVHKRISDIGWRSGSSLRSRTQTPFKPDPMSAARQQLAQQVADLITSESPRTSGRGGELEDLIGMLSSDPFLSKKEIPRTPENLLSDIRTCWRQAIQSDASDSVTGCLEAQCLDSPAEIDSHCSQIDLSMACFLSTSHVSDHNDSLDTRTLPSFGTPNPRASNISSTMNRSSSEQVELVLPLKGPVSETVTPPVEQNTYGSDDQSVCSLMGSSLLPHVHRQENPSAHTTLSWDGSKMVDHCNSLDNSGVIQFGILHETLPDKLGNLSLNSTYSTETSDILENHSIPDDLFLGKPENSLTVTDCEMDIHSLRSCYEALKTAPLSLTESGKSERQTPKLSKNKSESSPSLDSGNLFSPSERGLTLNFEYLMTPSPNDRKLSLPQLISFSPAEDILIKSDAFGDVLESQAVTNLNKTFEFVPDPVKSTDEGMGQLLKL